MFFFFFQAEDGIRDKLVTGVQTCALPISFRADLFYRLSVFPIEMPPLRERTSDIPLLVAYFADRYASNAGKTIRHVDKRTLDLVRSYRWPGNVRELQNVIERAVIVCETDTLVVDENWLSKETLATQPPVLPLGDARSEEHTSELQSLAYLVCRLLLEKKKNRNSTRFSTPPC